MMKIFYLANAASIHTRRWVEYFADNGHKVHLISYSRLQDKIPNVTLHLLALPKPHIKILSAVISFIPDIVQIRRLIKKLKPDIVHAHYALGYGFFGAVSGFHPFVLSAWGSDVMVEPRQNAIFNLLVKAALAKADVVLTTSQYLKTYLGIRFNLAESKVIALPWGVQLETFIKGYKTEGQQLKRSLKIEDRRFIVLSPRHLREHYRIEKIVEAIPYVAAKYPKVALIVLKGAAENTQFENRISGLIKQLGIRDNVRLIGKHLNAEEMAVMYNISDAFISIPKSDQFGSTIQEGMACGSIPIVGNLEVYRQYLADGNNALFVDPEDPVNIAEKIIYCVENPEVKQRFYTINREIIEESEDWTRNMVRAENLYRNLLRVRSTR